MMVKFSLALLAALTLFAMPLFIPTAQAQEPEAGQPSSPALAGIASRLAGSKAAPHSGGAAATHFTPAGHRLTLDALVNNLAKSPDQKDGVRQVFQETFKVYEAAATKVGMENDVAGALAFYLCMNYSAYHDGQEISDAETLTVAKQLQTALDNDAMRGAKNEDKQKLYEFFVMMGGFTAATSHLAAQQNDATLKKQVRQIGGDGLRSILKVAPERVRITEAGIAITPEGGAGQPTAATRPASSAGAGGGHSVSNISYQLPNGWSEANAGAGIKTLSISTEAYSGPNDVASLILMPGRDKSGRLQDTAPTVWHDFVLSNFDGEQHPFVYVRQLPSGLNCAFIQETMTAKNGGARTDVTLYVLDAGKALYPVIAMYTGITWKHDKEVEQIITGLKIAGATAPAALVTPHELAGVWSTKASAIRSYVTASGQFAGDASIVTDTTLTFHGDGTYSSDFRGYNAGRFIGEKEAGTFKIEGDIIVMYDKKTNRTTKKRFIGMAPTPDGKKMMILYNPGQDFSAGSIRMYGDKYGLTSP